MLGADRSIHRLQHHHSEGQPPNLAMLAMPGPLRHLNKPPWGRRAAYGDIPLDVENPESHTAGRQKPFGLPAIKLA